MKNLKTYFWGIALIIIGVVLGLNQLNITQINIFFEGWWTLFIIVPFFIDFFEGDDKTSSLIGMGVGIALLLAARDIISFEIIWKLALPTILITWGLSIVFKDTLNTKINKKIKEINKKNGENLDSTHFTTFGGDEIKVENENFDGANLTAVFGGLDYDLSNITIKKDCVINCVAIFGGIDIIAPKNVNIMVKSASLFGGVSNKKHQNDEKTKTIYINASCIFGGVEIK